MKALTIRQPWAWAILCAGKDIENRLWRSSHRGRIAVHAARAMTAGDYDTFAEFFESAPIILPPGVNLPAFEELTLGTIVGTVEIVDCVQETESPWYFGFPGYGFHLRYPRPLAKPISCKGMLKFWDVPAEIEREILRQIKL